MVFLDVAYAAQVSVIFLFNLPNQLVERAERPLTCIPPIC